MEIPYTVWNGKLLCPRCDHQGIICRVRVKDLDMIVYICDECDALWSDENKVGTAEFQQYETFMEAHGLPGLWSQVDNIEKEWRKRT